MNSACSQINLDKLHELLFDVRRSVRYHNKRRQFYDRVSRCSDTLTALSGSGTIISTVSAVSSYIPILLASTTAIFSSINLVLDTRGNGRLHHDLARQFIAIEKVLISPSLTSQQFAKAESDRLDIEAGEPPVLRVLDLICHNELLKAMAYEENEQFDIKIWRSVFANFFDLFPSSIKKKGCQTDEA